MQGTCNYIPAVSDIVQYFSIIKDNNRDGGMF